MKFFLAFALFFFTSCSLLKTKEQPIPAQPQEKLAFSQLQKKVLSNPSQKNIELLIDFIEKNPKSSLNDDAAMLLGDTFFKRNQFLKSYDSYMSIVRSDVFSPREVEAYLGASKSLVKRGQYDEAISLLDKSLELNPEVNRQKQIHLEKLKVYSLTENHLKSIDSLVSLMELEFDSSLKNQYFVKAIRTIENKLDFEDLEYVVSHYRNDKIQGVAQLKLGEKYLEKQDYQRAGKFFEEVVQLVPKTEWSEVAEGYLNQIYGRKNTSGNTIGVILPLSGRHARIAEKVLNGLQLGLGIFGSSRSNVKLAVIDSQGSPDIARRGVEKLVSENQVIAIVGGLLSKTSMAISAKCVDLGIPNISLSQKSDITEMGNFIFRNALTSQMQVKFLVKNAMKKGMKKFAVLYPKDAYGKEYFNLFWNEVKNQGGEITSVQSYEPKETDFNTSIKKLVGTFYVNDRKKEYNKLLAEWKLKNKNSRKHPPADLLPPVVDFDALFIPDNSRAVGQIAPMLAYNNVKDVVLIGTNLWNTSSLVRRGQRYVEKALFVDFISSKEKEFINSNFYKIFYKQFDRTPTHFEAQGYDTGLLILKVLRQDINRRDGFRDSLAEIENFHGVTGIITSVNREFHPPLTLYTVEKGKIVAQ